MGAGELFVWDTVSDVVTQGYRLAETSPIPETNFTVAQNSLTVVEWGNSVH